MKILHITTNFYPTIGGIETFVYEVSRKMVEKGHKVYVVTSDKGPSGNEISPKKSNIDDINVKRFPFHSFLRYTRSIKALKFIRSKEWDVIHIHNIGFFTDFIPLFKSKAKKIFLHTHGGIFHTKKLSLFKYIYWNTYKIRPISVDKIIAHSDHDFKLFSEIFDKKKIELINYGIDWEKLSKIKNNSNNKTIVYIGRLSSNKRLERIIKILPFIKKEIPDIKLMLIGSDWGEKNKLIKLAKKLDVVNNINFIGSIPHKKVYDYFSKADVFMLSSDYEGFGISVIEAMAAGLVVIVNDIPTMREEIIKDKKDGFIKDFDDYKGVAELTLKVLRDKNLRRTVSSNAKMATKKYRWEKILLKLNELYK